MFLAYKIQDQRDLMVFILQTGPGFFLFPMLHMYDHVNESNGRTCPPLLCLHLQNKQKQKDFYYENQWSLIHFFSSLLFSWLCTRCFPVSYSLLPSHHYYHPPLIWIAESGPCRKKNPAALQSKLDLYYSYCMVTEASSVLESRLYSTKQRML